MKKFIVLFVFMCTVLSASAQVSINTDGSEPNPSAMLEVKSIDKGFLPPRMTTEQMNGIVSPIAGLLVYNTLVNALYWFDGANWQRFNEFNYTETDPVFALHPSSSIGSWDIGNWNQAYTNRLVSVHGTTPMTLQLENNQLSCSIQPASAIQSGYLTVTDWNSFNNKVSSQWMSIGTTIHYNTGNVGLGTSNPQSTLDIAGNAVIGSGFSGASPAPANGLIVEGKAGFGTDAPAASAVLDVTSTSLGILLPRMTRTQRNSILLPAEGLMVYCTNCGTAGALSIFTNGTWLTFSPCTTAAPAEGTPQLTPGRVIWNWQAVAGAAGYKWNTVADYETATDMGAALTKTETEIVCDTTYTRFVWAYSSCGESAVATLTAAVPATPPDAPSEGIHTATQTSITWNWNTVTGATGYKWNTTDDYSTAMDLNATTTYSETGDTCGTVYSRFVWAYNGCGCSAVDTLTQTTLPCWTCGISTLTINHTPTAGVAPVTKTTTYGTVTNIPGELTKCWITKNLGATLQATAVNDNTEASAGWYWQFNLKQGFQHDGTIRTPGTTWISTIYEYTDWQTVNDPCNIELGTQWRIPTYTEWYNVDNTGGWTNWNGPWGSALKLHAAGYLIYSNGFLYDRGTLGFLWSGTHYISYFAYSLYFSSSTSYMLHDVSGCGKAYGYSVRCIRDY